MSGGWDDSSRVCSEVIRMLESSFTDPMTSLWKRMRSVLIRWFSRVSRFRSFSLSEYSGRQACSQDFLLAQGTY